MKPSTLLPFLCLLFLSACTHSPAPPNIIYILADDLGYGELGAYGQQLIETPNIDALAASGMRFTQHYSGSPVCAPSRSVLLTGQHSGHTYIRGNDELPNRGNVWNYFEVFEDSSLEGQRPLPDSVITLAEVLKTRGYTSGIFGKWGLGNPGSEGTPTKQGFDRFFGYNCQRQAHTLFPKHLWDNEARVLLNNEMVSPHTGLEAGADVSDTSSYAQFHLNDYAPTLIHHQALRFIQDNSKKPFFLYYASPIPHVPLQAPKKWVEYYRRKLGEETPYTANSYFPNLTPRATYAAMITYLDEQVGELVSTLKAHDLYDNTLIIFSSDNGPTYAGGADTEFFDSAQPFSPAYGRAKGFLYEGGIRVPMIAAWQGKVSPGSISSHISAFYDVMPTLCDIIGVPIPEHTDGISFLPTLLGAEQRQQHAFLYWEFPSYKGQQAVRMGKWKAVRQNIFEGNLKTELYNLEEDQLELVNIAAAYPDVVADMEAIMASEHVISPVSKFRFPQLGDL